MNLWIIKSNQIKSNQIKSNQIKSNQIKSNQIKSNQIKSNQIKSNQIKSNQIKSNQIKSNQIKSNQIKSNQIKSNQIKSNQIKSNQIKFKPMNIKPKTFLIATLCTAAVLFSCGGDDPVTPKVEADFTFESGTERAVTFKNTSKNATSYAWDFGDGNTSKEENPTHTYTKDSTYTVKLTATNAGGSATKTATLTVTLTGASIQVVANFTFEADSETAGKVTFKNTSENATNYTWDFGDGNKSTDENPVHTYAKDGTYTVKLTAKDSSGKSNDKTATITLNGTSIQVVASFTFTKGTEGGTVTFTNASENATSYAWDFGDQNTSTDENPTHMYAKDGTYTVKLTARNAGKSADTTATVTIDNAITIAIADLSQLTILENRPKGDTIGEIAATVANTNKTPVYSIASQTPADAVGIEGNKMVVKDPSAFDYATRTEITGEIQGTIGSVTATVAFTISIEEIVNIPDEKLKAELVESSIINTNGDGEISVKEARAYTTGFALDDRGIADATGIEYFINITLLDMGSNDLTAIDVSNNTALTELYLGQNQLTAIDVSKNTALTKLYLNNNQLTSVDLSQNTALTLLYLTDNPKLTCIKVKDPNSIPSGWSKDASASYRTDCN